ncbi:haloacid dehalogenase-like hydrolase domain-containing 5 [Lytechinus variegatus]|uniref:haloacid dehalogenase-like hydrolase domain-containing 5 n=1 Tax=Lytechinus variegatus TaxID=7654 RepID=UPI001BB18332|nr:haloacid dehalogenase-like hydrolase domain-containing 5 [Lytechinus variegatus]
MVSLGRFASRTLFRVPTSNVYCSHSHRRRLCVSHQHFQEQNLPSFGLLFDIDGVLKRGKTVLPEAQKAFRLLTNDKGKMRVPTVFITNAGNSLREQKASELTDILEVPITPDQVVMSHSPLRILPQFHDKHVLVSGQGPVVEIANMLGFNKVITIEEVRDLFPHLDCVSHKRRRPSSSPSTERILPPIEAVVLFGEPVRWETNLQLILDVLMTDGQLELKPLTVPRPHIPILGCNMDLLWMAEAHLPRLGHGSFLLCLEALYKKVTGHDLRYTVLTGKPSQITYHYAEHVLKQQARTMGIQQSVRTLYAIGDNPMTDIYGANLYNHYLTYMNMSRVKKSMSIGSSMNDPGDKYRPSLGGTPGSDFHDSSINLDKDWNDIIAEEGAESIESILVCTGVYSKRDSVEKIERDSDLDLDHGHRDFKHDPDLLRPSIEVQDVLEAIEEIFKIEKFS